MRLLHCTIENVKLLESVKFDFSVDPQRPLTVIRAENGSGKTSLLYALLWAFYGMPGLPAAAQGLRLVSSAVPAGQPVPVSVMVEFEHTDDMGELSRYRLIRSMTETPSQGDKVERQNERLRLLRITAAGEEDVAQAEGTIAKMVPLRLKDVFFTNGDDVQRFISGHMSAQQRQTLVHTAIKALLGHETLRTGVEDINSVYMRLRSEAAKAGGADTEKLEEQLRRTDEELENAKNGIETLSAELARMDDMKQQWEKDLQQLRGIGDLDELNARIERVDRERTAQEAARARALARMRLLLKSESFSWHAMGSQMQKGLEILQGLADRSVIPGTSIQVLKDRLGLELCICGTPLTEGSDHRRAVEELLEQQASIDASRQRLTQLNHQARTLYEGQLARDEAERGFETERCQLLQEFLEARDGLQEKGLELEALKEKRSQIDEERVRNLTDRIRGVEAKAAEAMTRLGGLQRDVTLLDERRETQFAAMKQAQKAVKINDDLATRRDVAQDLLDLTRNTLATLEGEYVERVSDRMNELFMSIVGSDPEFEAGVFAGVRIDATNNIVIDTQRGRRLDADFELNGASQRALTLSFIWALMEISGTVAPRIIDTPLGMVAGGVKTRMVDTITRPPAEGSPEFQVVLLLTRSEIRDVEELLDERAGSFTTLSCSKDYPEDLRFSWEVDHPVSRTCSCTHKQSCRVCARQYDEQHGITFRDLEAAR